MTNIKELKERIINQQNENDAITYQWNVGLSYEENIKIISNMTIEGKPVKTDFQSAGYIIPAGSNIVDTELSIIEQRNKKKESLNNREDALKAWQDIRELMDNDVLGNNKEIIVIGYAKEIFKRFPEDRNQIDLPQTLRLFNILRQSRNPENRALLPEIEQDLQAKAWRYFGSETKYTESEPKKVRPTPYSVSCIGELKDYMVNKMHAPEDVIEPKLKNIETSMMSSIYTATLQDGLTPEAAALVYKTAMENPEHGSSQRILKNINHLNRVKNCNKRL